MYSFLDQYFHRSWFLKPALTVIRVSWGFLLIIGVIDYNCIVSFWSVEVSADHAYILAYSYLLLLEQQMKLVLTGVFLIMIMYIYLMRLTRMFFSAYYLTNLERQLQELGFSSMGL